MNDLIINFNIALHPDLEDLLNDIVDIIKDGGDTLDTINDYLQVYSLSDMLYSHIGDYI